MLTQTAEDYLETIYLLGLRIGKVKTTDIAAEFGIKTPSVISALKNLRSKGYLSYESYGYVELSDKGIEKALYIYERHKLVFRFLHFVLGVDEKTASDDTCGLEHYLSEQSFSSLKDFFAFLNSEKLTGNDIVSKFQDFKNCLVEANIDTEKVHTLASGKVGSTYRINKLNGTREMKRRFLNMGVIPGEKVTIKNVGLMGDPMEISIQGYLLSLRKNEIQSIIVEEVWQ